MTMRTITPVVCLSALLTGIYAAPAADAAAGKFTYYDLLTPNAGPCDLTTGPDGAIWGESIIANLVFRVDPKTGKVEEYEIPYTNLPIVALPAIAGRGSLQCAIQPGADGNLYGATGIRNQFLRINPTTKNITVFTPTPPNILGNLQPLNDLWTGPQGMYFSQTTANVITYFDYKTEKFTNYQVPTPLSTPVGIFHASDGGLWFCEFTGGKMGRLDPKTGTIKEYPVPPEIGSPTVVRAETEGRYIWFTSFLTNAIGRIDIYTGETKAFFNPSPLSFPTEDTVDGEGNIWFSTATQNTLNKLIPSTGEFVTIKQPGTLITAPISVPPAINIAMHYGPGNAMWFTDVSLNKVGRYQL